MSREKKLLIYIVAIFEYAFEVLDNCGMLYLNKVEDYHIEAAQIISGLPACT